MSETETILLIVLGFSLASLVALFMGRLLWTAAVKVGVRRMQRQVPSSLVGIQTERDRLRAEYAMLSQRLGSRLEDAKLRLAEQMAEVSRHRNRLLLSEKREKAHEAEMEKLRARLTELEDDLADRKAKEEERRRKREEKRAKAEQAKSAKPYEKPKSSAPTSLDEAELRLRQRVEQLSRVSRAKQRKEAAAAAAASAAAPREEAEPAAATSSPDASPVVAAEPSAEPAVPVPVETPPKREPGDILSRKLAEAERQTRELEAELRKLDSERPLAPPRNPEPEEKPEGEEAQGDNIILLPHRGRDAKTSTPSSS